jgi:glycine oxidase
VGGGVIRIMMTALKLADAGHNVTAIERGECGHEVSWAGWY